MKKRIEINFIDDTHLQIVEQTHRNCQFGDNGEEFNASNGIRFCSSSFPDAAMRCSSGFHGLYVRGDSDGCDDYIVTIPNKRFGEAVKKAVEEYNARFAS